MAFRLKGLNGFRVNKVFIRVNYIDVSFRNSRWAPKMPNMGLDNYRLMRPVRNPFYSNR